MLFYKVYQSLWSHSYKFCKNTYISSRHIHKGISTWKKLIPLDIFVTENADIYEKITGPLSSIEWKDIREKIFQRNQDITPVNVDSIIINICVKNFHLNNAIAYFKFLKKNNYPLNVAVIGKYLSLYALKQDSLTDADKTEIIETYNALRQKHSYLDSFTAEHCIVSLCLTDEWEKTCEIIKMMKITSTPGPIIYSALASAAFRHGKSDIAWKALTDMVLCKLIPQNNVYISHLQYCQLEDTKVFNSRMEEMFNFLAQHSITPYDAITSAYVGAARKHGWSTELVTIPKETGNCKHCGYSLSKITFNAEEFQKLAKSVMDKVLIGSDIYYKTNPKELSNFQQFIEKTKPYDIVIDGLNLTYTQSKLKPKLLQLINLIEHFRKRKKKILVLTRKHQKKLSEFKYIQQQAYVFLLDDISVDDPYILYATMASGMDARFVSLDLMRQHKHSLQDEHLQQAFKKWQYSHQYFVKPSRTGIRIQEPFASMPIIQKSNDCWHLPRIGKDMAIINSYEFPKEWYCLRP